MGVERVVVTSSIKDLLYFNQQARLPIRNRNELSGITRKARSSTADGAVKGRVRALCCCFREVEVKRWLSLMMVQVTIKVTNMEEVYLIKMSAFEGK